MRQRDAELAAAASVEVPARADVVVLGGGPSGLVAGICAAEDGARVVVLERDATCGRRILATGNGRCNFCNLDLAPAHYNDLAFAAAVMGESALDEVLGFFLGCGLRWADEDGRLYPLSRQAASVRNVLLARARRSGAILAPARTVRQITPDGASWQVDYEGDFGAAGQVPRGSVRAGAVVVATGGGVLPAVRGLGLPQVPCEPVLCPLACEGVGGDGVPALDLAQLDGRRFHGTVTLLRAGRPVASERGEVLFRPYGISGIAAFNLSRHARPGDVVRLDLAPDLAQAQLVQSLRAAGSPDGVLDPVIAQTLGRMVRPGDQEGLAYLAKHLDLQVQGPAETQRAQVTRGGLAAEGFDPATLEARGPVPTGLFACGEALDVDGPCGGYNLAWAWLSGMRAGRHAAARARRRG